MPKILSRFSSPTLPHSGLISGKKIEETLNGLTLKDKTFDDLYKIRLPTNI
jgi:hypothetical protein